MNILYHLTTIGDDRRHPETSLGLPGSLQGVNTGVLYFISRYLWISTILSNIPYIRCGIVPFGQTESWQRILLNAGTSAGAQQPQSNIFLTKKLPKSNQSMIWAGHQPYKAVWLFAFLRRPGDTLFASSSRSTWCFSGLVDPLELASA